MSDQKKVAFYIRVSTKHQDTPEGSLKSQEQRLEEWRKYHNSVNANDETGTEALTFTEAKVFKDVESGASRDKRPGYQNMLLEIKNNKLGAIACTSISRLNRNLREFYDLMDLCDDNKVDIISLKEKFDTSTAIGRALLKFMLVFYELEREQTSERGKENLYARFKRGLWRSGTLTGYEKDPNRAGYLIPIPEEVELINKIFDTYIATGSVKKTLDILAKEGYKTSSRPMTGNKKSGSNELSDATTRRILRNKLYIGISQWKKENINRKDITDPMEKYQEVPGVWEGIVTEEKFNLANQILDANRASKGNFVSSRKKVYELTGIIQCGECSNREYLSTSSGTGKMRKTYRYYRCKKCGLKIGAEKAEKIVLSQLKELSKDKETIKDLVKDTNKRNSGEISLLKRRLKGLIGEREDIDKEMDSVIEQFANIELTETLKNRLLKKDNEFKIRLKKVVDEEQQIQADIDKIEGDAFTPELFANVLGDISVLADKMTPLIRRKLLQFSLSQCELTKNELIIHISNEVKKIPLYKEKAVANKVFGATAIMRD